jgi:hypothetical protein
MNWNTPSGDVYDYLAVDQMMQDGLIIDIPEGGYPALTSRYIY